MLYFKHSSTQIRLYSTPARTEAIFFYFFLPRMQPLRLYPLALRATAYLSKPRSHNCLQIVGERAWGIRRGLGVTRPDLDEKDSAPVCIVLPFR